MRNYIIFSVLLFGLFLLCEYNWSHTESKIYLKSDIKELKNSLFFVSILISIVVTFLFEFKKNLAEGKWKKINHIFHLGIMSFLIYPIIANIILISGLRLNRISENGQLNQPFIIKIKDLYENNDNYVWGIIPNKTEYGQTEKIMLTETLYDQVEEGEEIQLNLKKGIFGVPYEPIGTK